MLTLQLKERKQIIEIVCLFQYFPMKQSLFISVSQATVAIKYRASDRKRIATTALTDWRRKIPIYSYCTFSNKHPLFDKCPLPNKRPLSHFLQLLVGIQGNPVSIATLSITFQASTTAASGQESRFFSVPVMFASMCLQSSFTIFK